MTTAESPKVDRRFSLGRLGAAALILALLLAIFSVVIVETGQVGVVIRTGADAPSRVLDEPGFYVRLPFAERVWLIDTRLQTDEQSAPQAYTTQDGQTLQLAAWVAWRVSDPILFNTSTASGKNPAGERVLSALGKSLTTFAQGQSVASLQQGPAVDDLAQWLSQVNADLASLGIAAEQVGLRQVSLPDAANEVIYKKMASGRLQAEQRLVQGLSSDEQQLVALQNKQRDQVLGDAYSQGQQQRQMAESKLIAAYARQYGQAAAVQDRLKEPPPATTTVPTPAGTEPARSE